MAFTAVGDDPAAPPAAATPEPVAAPDAWRETLIPADLRADPSLKDYKTPQDLVRSHVEQGRLIGRKTEGMVKVPTAASTPEEQAAWRKASGVPETPDKYTFPLAKDLEAAFPKAAQERWAPIFHKLGVPASTAQQVVTAFAEDQASQKVALQQAYRAQQAEAKDAMGEASYNRHMAMAEAGAKYVRAKLGEKGQAFADLLDLTLIGDHPLFIEAFSILGLDLAEDGHIAVEGVAGGSLDAAKERIAVFLTGKAPATYTDAQRKDDYRLVTDYDPSWRAPRAGD